MNVTSIDIGLPPLVAMEREDEVVTVFCERCTAHTAYWQATRSAVPSSVEEHVTAHHAPNGVGPARPSGRPVWVEGEDWWVIEDDA